MATISGQLKKDILLGWIIVNPNDDFVCFLDNVPLPNLISMKTHYKESLDNRISTSDSRSVELAEYVSILEAYIAMKQPAMAINAVEEPRAPSDAKPISDGIAHVSDRIEMVARRVREKLELIEQIKANLTEEGGGLFRSRVHGPDGYVYCNIILTECGEWRLLTSGMAHVKTPHQKTDLDTVVNTILARWH